MKNADGAGSDGRAGTGPGASLRSVVMMVVVTMVVLRGSKSRGGNHHQQQGGENNLLHGLNVALYRVADWRIFCGHSANLNQESKQAGPRGVRVSPLRRGA